MVTWAIWAGSLKLESATLPVKLYSAVQDQSIHFHILDAKTKSSIKQHMVNPETGEEVPFEDIRKGYDLRRFVNKDEIPPIYFEHASTELGIEMKRSRH